MLVLEALRARFGDALVLHSGTKAKPQLTVIDGGPPGVYGDALRPRLEALREERGLGAATPLDVDLMMVSHIDDDHVSGLLELVQKLNDRRESGQPLPWKIRRFWHNSFDDILDNDDLQVAGGGSALSAASLGDFLAPEGSAILASVKQGRELAKLLDALTLGGNPPFKGLVLTDGKAKAMTVGDLKITVIAPRRSWRTAEVEQEIKPLLKAEPRAAGRRWPPVDKSVQPVEHRGPRRVRGKRILLTRTARRPPRGSGGGRKRRGRKLRLDVLKLPHHGSERNVAPDYFETIVAKHYVVSADGKFDNPDVGTLKMISAARPDDDFTIHLTYPLDKFNVPKIGQQVAKFFAAEKKAGRAYKVVTRAPEELALRLALV
jgi:hypothetical protein